MFSSVEREDRCFAFRVDHGKDALQFRIVIVDLLDDFIWEIGVLRERDVRKCGFDTTFSVNAKLALRHDHRAGAVQGVGTVGEGGDLLVEVGAVCGAGVPILQKKCAVHPALCSTSILL